jgi:N-methylhydantoinase A
LTEPGQRPAGRLRLAVDTGGTFTDLVVRDQSGRMQLFKVPTVPADPAEGVLAVLRACAAARGTGLAELLGSSELFIHGTTRAINAVLTGATARTAFLTTAGHPDILLFREGGRLRPFDHTIVYPDPYVPRRLTFEIQERVDWAGNIVVPLKEQDATDVIDLLRSAEVEAVGVCLLWSIVNPAHELMLGGLLRQHLPGVAVTLSHQLNPAIREYRRASSTCIDASLKPVMSRYLADLDARLRGSGFAGRTLVVTSGGGVLDMADVARAPIHSLASGPAVAPIAGRHFARADAGSGNAIVADAGGTTYDVSLVRDGVIPWTREAWIGEEYSGHITGFPSVDVKSVGAGGGSIAWVDDGGLLHVGPASAGADPGPACYARGGRLPTVTDAYLVLGILDPDYFLGGARQLDRSAAVEALERELSPRLGLDAEGCAAAVAEVVTEEMVRAIEERTVYRGVDPQSAVLVAGGGAAGLNCTAIARRLGCPTVIVPELAAGLSALGALLSDLFVDHFVTMPTSSDAFAYAAVNDALQGLAGKCREFIGRVAGAGDVSSVELSVEARYPDQIWELEIPLRGLPFAGQADVGELRSAFHATHERLFGVQDAASAVEFVTWRGRARVRLPELAGGAGPAVPPAGRAPGERVVRFGQEPATRVPVHDFASVPADRALRGPLLVESAQTTIVVPSCAAIRRAASGSLVIDPWAASDPPTSRAQEQRA